MHQLKIVCLFRLHLGLMGLDFMGSMAHSFVNKIIKKY